MIARRASLILLGVACVVVACAGTGTRATTATRYQGILLNARNLGAGELARESAADPTVAAYVARHGAPDFVLLASPRDLELVYVQRSVLAFFRRPPTGPPSVVSELTPLPGPLYNMLPADIRAGTSSGLESGVPNCWTVPVAGESCRTCCLGPGACTVDCRPASSG